MSGGLKMPRRGQAAQLLSELNAEHAPLPPPEPEQDETNVTTLQPSNERAPEESLQATGEGSNERPVEASRQERLTRAQQIAAEDEIAVVTVRVSARLNEYMDRYVERMNRIHPKRRYRKQDAVAEAFAAFFADHPMPPAPVDEEL